MVSRVCICVLLCFCFTLRFSYGISTMAIDLGTDFTKVAVVRPGIPLEIALDNHSKRTIPTLVLLKEGNRLFGNGAVASMTRDPTIVFAELPSIIGKTLEHPSVIAYMQRYPYHNLVFSTEYGQIAFKVNEKEYTVETLLAMFLQYVRKTAEAFAASEMSTAVITVPSFFSQAERRAVLRAANLANIEVIQLIDSNVAVALDFIRPRVKLIEDKPTYMFFDVGATGTTATVVSYQMAKVKGDTAIDHPHVFILGTASDPWLGTNMFIDRLQAHLIDKFKAANKINADISKSVRTIAKFRREAVRLFKILSANKEINSVVEEVYDGRDLRLKVTREELEAMCSDLVQRFPKVIQAALETATTDSTKLRDVILFGGGSRIPIVQATILATTNREALGKSINSDEAAVMGAVYQAASSTRGFLVKKFILRDSNRYPVAVTFPRVKNDSAEEEELVTRVLFPANIPFPQKRTIKFPHLRKDISFRINYTEGVPQSYATYLKGSEDIMNVSITGVKEEIEKFEKTGNVPQAVKAHLELDVSGILQLTEVNLLMVDGKRSEESESSHQNIADGISSLFGTTEGEKQVDSSTEALSSSDKSQNVTEPANITPANTTVSGSATTRDRKTMIHPLSFQVQILDAVNPPRESVGTSMAILDEYEAADLERDRLNEAKNELERSIFATQGELDAAFDGHATDAEVEAVRAVANEISLWYDDESHHAPRSEVEEQLNRLMEAVSPLRQRLRSYAELPKALEEMELVLSGRASSVSAFMRINSVSPGGVAVSATDFLLNDTVGLEDLKAPRATGLPIYTSEEVEALRKLVAELQIWLRDSREALERSDRRSDPPVRLVAVKEKTAALEARLLYLTQKGDTWVTTYHRLFDIRKATLAAEANATDDNATKSYEMATEPPEDESVAETVEDAEAAPELEGSRHEDL